MTYFLFLLPNRDLKLHCLFSLYLYDQSRLNYSDFLSMSQQLICENNTWFVWLFFHFYLLMRCLLKDIYHSHHYPLWKIDSSSEHILFALDFCATLSICFHPRRHNIRRILSDVIWYSLGEGGYILEEGTKDTPLFSLLSFLYTPTFHFF